MKTVSTVKKFSLSLVLGLSALLCSSASMANTSAEDPRVQGIDIDLIYSIDATQIPHHEFPQEIKFYIGNANCMNKLPGFREFKIPAPGFYVLSPERIENKHRENCFGSPGKFRVDATWFKINGGRQVFGSREVQIAQTGFVPPTGTMSLTMQPPAYGSMYLSKTRCVEGTPNCHDTSPVDVRDYETVYLHIVLS